MKNYPLNPFISKWKNWTNTYLKELNSKIYALKNYSDFSLANYTEVEIFYSSLSTKEKGTIVVIDTTNLTFHDFARITQECYLITDYKDLASEVVTQVGTGILYHIRPVSSGTTIISNARAEGSIDADTNQTFDLLIYDDDISVQNFIPLSINENSIISSLGLASPSYGPSSPARSDWKNFVIQPSGYASLYIPEPSGDGLTFYYNQYGSESYGTNLNLLLFFQNARYIFEGNDSSATSFSTQRYGISLSAYTSGGIPQIVTINDSNTEIIPWIAKKNPLMNFTFANRDKENQIYGEEIILDKKWYVSTTKFGNMSSLVYNILIPENHTPPENVFFEVDLV